MTTALLKMTQVPITSRYGPRILNGKQNTHKGTDHAFGSAMGVSSYGDGIVTFAGQGTGANAERGIYVEVAHVDFIGTSYHSLSKIAKGIVKGVRVKMGDILGFGGKSALGATGHHCHVGLWLNGQHVDETRFLKPGVIVSITNTGNVSVVSAGGATTITPPAPAPLLDAKDDDMKLFWDTAGTGYLQTEDGILALPSPQVYNLFYRLINSNQKLTPFIAANNGRPESYLKAEVDIMNYHLDLLSLQAATKVEIDPTKLASAVADELRKKGITVELKDLDWSVDTGELIAKQVATAYESAVPRITNAIIKAQGEALVAAGK